MDIHFGVNTWLWTSPFDLGAVTLFPQIKAMGFDVVEIPIEDPLAFCAGQVRAALDEHGLEPVIIGAFGKDRDLSSDNSAVRRNGLDYVQSCLTIGQALGARIFAGPAYSAVGKARNLPADARTAEWDRAVGSVRSAGAMAGDSGMILALEPLNRFESDMVNNTFDALRFIGQVAHPAVGIALDNFHMHIEEANVEAAIRAAGDYLVHVQVSESHRGIPGTGQFDWDGLRRGLEAIGYSGAVSIESFSPGCSTLAEAVCIWKPLAASQDLFAQQGFRFLERWANPLMNKTIDKTT